MKKIYFLLLIQIAALTISAQNSDSSNLARPDRLNLFHEKSEYQGYTIKLIPASIGKFGFDISNVNRAAFRHYQNPLAFSHAGIKRKEDAYKIAQWLITQHVRTGHWVNLVPPHIIRELKIELSK